MIYFILTLMDSGRLLTAVVWEHITEGVILFLPDFGTGEGDALNSFKNGEKLRKQK